MNAKKLGGILMLCIEDKCKLCKHNDKTAPIKYVDTYEIVDKLIVEYCQILGCDKNCSKTFCQFRGAMQAL